MNAKRILLKGIIAAITATVAVTEISAQSVLQERQYTSRERAKTESRSVYMGLDCQVQTVGSYADGNNSPFWFSSNRQGLVQERLTGGYGRVAFNGLFAHSSGLFLDYGIDGICGGGYQSEMFLQQAYANLGFRYIDISIGKRERWGELADPDLSSGSLTWSGNSRPIPQVRLEIPEFTRLPILGNWFSIKGHLAYGYYEDADWIQDFTKDAALPMFTQNTKYHSKAGFIKFGDTNRFPLEVTLGLEMYAQFGGTGYNLKFQDSPGHPVDPVYKLPEDKQTYLAILLPFNETGNQSRLNGNTLGSWHLAFNTEINDWKYMLRYEHFFEDHSSMLGIEYKRNIDLVKKLKFYGFQNNWFDGLFALEIKAPRGMWLNKAVLEFLNTYSQCGPVNVQHNLTAMPNIDGRDNIYEHYVYQSYSYFGNYMGSPILVSPIYNTDGSLYPKSTRTMAWHLGIDGKITDRIGFRYKISHSRHWGTYTIPLRNVETITSQLAELSYTTPEEIKFILSVGSDRDRKSGNQNYLLGNQRGVMMTIETSVMTLSKSLRIR